ncbi:MAG: M56 family metallopeptidase [Clostridium sp.]|nr:M56 family metallopeptidase [Acetatifactor muris]MCM1527734.1 M56 family metallopeptidase [Bacteroides sp.]MCM1563735.1 M56 family metallopeptidase [Clostridium sp.]
MEILRACVGMSDFAATYGLIKCLNSMVMGLVFLCVIFLLRKRRADCAGRNLYLLLLLFPAVFGGMSRLFFTKPFLRITGLIYMLSRPWCGKIYFTICILLLLRLGVKRVRMRGYLRTLPEAADRDFVREAVSCVTGGARTGISRKYLSGVRVLISGENVSPFAGGILHPYVVMPQKLWEDRRSERCRLVLCHELIHIRSGHIVWLTLFELLKIYWWGNPLIYPVVRKLREELEPVCDEQCVACTGVSAAGYGRTMLDMLAMLEPARDIRIEGSPAFMRPDAFRDLSRRIGRLAHTGKAEDVLRKHGRQRMYFAGAMAVVLAAVFLTSYPRFTVMKELVLYDEQCNLVDYDSPALRAAARVQDGKLVLDKERFGELIADAGITGEYVYLSYDTIYKIPGCGGGGNAGMISLKDYDDIFYLAADCRENRFMVFCLKYLL